MDRGAILGDALKYREHREYRESKGPRERDRKRDCEKMIYMITLLLVATWDTYS